MTNELEKKMTEWAIQLEDQLAICFETFQSRGDEVYAASKELSEKSPLGAIQALNICMQIEQEFPGRLEECLERAEMVAKFTNGDVVSGIVSAIRYMRRK